MVLPDTDCASNTLQHPPTPYFLRVLQGVGGAINILQLIGKGKMSAGGRGREGGGAYKTISL